MGQFGTRMHDVQRWTLPQARAKIASLVPEHGSLFTKKALDMQFSAKTTQDDVQRFSLYTTHGEMPVDGMRFVFEVLQTKMLDACPNMFATAQSAYNLRFEMRDTFEQTVADATRIVSALMMDDRLQSGFDFQPSRKRDRSAGNGGGGNGGGAGGHKGGNGQKSGATQQQTKKSGPQGKTPPRRSCRRRSSPSSLASTRGASGVGGM